MKKIKLLVFLFGLTIAVSCGQQKRYVSYKVQKGETIEDIANRLNMSEDDLLRLNPDVSATPPTNTVIIIPNKTINSTNSPVETTSEEEIVEGSTPTEEETTEEATKNDDVYTVVTTDYETHTVQQGETVYRITKEYNISKDELLKLNPEFPDLVFNKLSVGQVLKVKANTRTIVVDKNEILKKYVTHEVQSKETIFSLTRFYNISKEDLMYLNPEYPEIKDNVLKVGQLIKIRPKDEETEQVEYKFYRDSITTDASVNVALLLPFRANEYDTIANKEIFKRNRLANMVTDFYLGAEIAIDSLSNQGITVNTLILDTGRKGKNIESIITSDQLDDMDAIIGPFYSEEAIELAREVDNPIIFPHFSNSQKDFSSSKLVKTAPDSNLYTEYLLSYLKDNYNNETIFVIGDGKKVSNAMVDKISYGLRRHDSIKTVHILKPEEGYIKKDRFIENLKDNKKAWFIMTSDDNVAVADALNSAIGFPDDVSVQVFAVNKNKGYNKIDNNKLAQIHFTYVTNMFADINSKEVNVFNEKYLEKNNSLPSEYAVKGFDITYDIIMRLASGEKLSRTFKDGTSFRLENKFEYRKKSGTYSNQGLYLVRYNNDLSLTRLK
ncbi:conserved protein of unknown function [Tenacibaculum sp. 190130A14a]|uniref:LysM domain-containing protein n=1 Tax=Tenacibaculum polynesiense TaxID=3137857 RepID=A0ABM9P9A3_9FLAO